MAIPRSLNEMTVAEAVDFLSSMAEADVQVLGEKKEIDWQDPSQTIQHQAVVKETFQVIHRYLNSLYQTSPDRLEEAETQRAVQALMLLSVEAASKLDRYTVLFKDIQGKQRIANLKEFQQLQHFYFNKIVQKISVKLKLPYAEAPSKIIELPVLEAVKMDKDPSLFFLKDQEGRPLYTPEVLKHFYLLAEADELISQTDPAHPLEIIKNARDRDLQYSAKEIVNICQVHLQEFYQNSKTLMHHELPQKLHKAVMALMLAANAKNLRENTQASKSCFNYFCDFHRFLREALDCNAYKQQSLKGTMDLSILLTQQLCQAFFMRMESVQDLNQLIKHFIKEEFAEQPIWDQLQNQDQKLRQNLERYPDGPIIKTFEVLQSQEPAGFDAYTQGFFPKQLYAIGSPSRHTTVLYLPAPLQQSTIQDVKVTTEFEGFLSNLAAHEEKHLLFFLHDVSTKTSHAQVLSLEKISGQYPDALITVALDEGSEFYKQKAMYSNASDAVEFIKHLKEHQFHTASFAPLKDWIDVLIETIHRELFVNKGALTKEERLSFIDIFNYFLILKFINHYQVDTISLTANGIDLDAIASTGFYCFLKIITKQSMQTDLNQLSSLLYASSLITRYRLVHQEYVERMIRTLRYLEDVVVKNPQAALAFESFYHAPLLSELTIEKPS